MTINPVTGIVVGAANPPVQRAGSSTSAATSFPSSADTAQFTDISAVSQPSDLQQQAGSFYQSAQQFAQALSAAQTATQGIGAQLSLVGQARALVQQAQDPALNSTDREKLNVQLQTLLSELNQVSGTQFGNAPVFDGNFTIIVDAGSNDQATTQPAADAQGQTSLQVPNLSSQSLFGNSTPSVLTPQDAQAAAQTLDQAASVLTSAAGSAGNFVQSVELASANIQSALFNTAAAGSTLSEADFNTGLAQLSLQQNTATQAQGNLPASLLSLIQ